MSLDHHGLLVRSVPRPVDRVRRDPRKIALLAEKSLVLNEEPDFSFEDIVDLLAFVNMRGRMIAGRAHGYFHAGIIAIDSLCRDRPDSFFPAPDRTFLGDIGTGNMQRHQRSPFSH